MIARIWHGWTTHENAGVYENLLKTEVFPSIKRIHKYEVEYITMMFFDKIQSVKEFAGEDYEKSYVPAKARTILSRHDERAQHYEIINEINYVI